MQIETPPVIYLYLSSSKAKDKNCWRVVHTDFFEVLLGDQKKINILCAITAKTCFKTGTKPTIYQTTIQIACNTIVLIKTQTIKILKT